MAVVVTGCGGEGFAAAASDAVSRHVRSRPSPKLCGLYSIGRNSCRFPMRQSLELSFFNRRNVEVRVAADYSDSKPESFKRRGKWGYHPLEDLSKIEKEEIEHAGDGKLTNAEVARTISEVNWSATIFSSVLTDKDAIFGTEVQYLVDDHGDLYFELEDDNEFLRSLSSTQIYSVLVGYGNVDGLQFTELVVGEAEEGHADSDSEEDSSDDSNDGDIEIYWEGVEDLKDMEDFSPEESFGSLGGWGGYESLDEVHPMDFASKVSEAASADYISEIDKPAKRLTISGVVRPVTEDEEPYIQGIWYDRFLLAGDSDDIVEQEEDDDNDDNEEKNGDEEHGHDGDDAELVAQGQPQDVHQDCGTSTKDQTEILTDVAKSEIQEDSYHGIIFDKPFNGAARHSKGENLEFRSKLVGASELSSSDHSVIEVLGNSSTAAEDLDTVRDDHREGNDVHNGSIVSGELRMRKNRNIKRGSLHTSDMKDEAAEVEASEIVLPPGATLEGDAVVGEWTQRSKSSAGASFYKLEIMSVLLDSAPGVQSTIDVRDFAYAEPDVLAHFSSAIMEQVNGGGKKTESALKALCQRAKGLDVEEVFIVGIDCLGVDLRVHCGIEVQTIRIPFSRRATCEDTADKLLDQLLFPRVAQKRPRKKGQERNFH